MVKSMFAAVAGLRAHQSKMDVIGNNIANVNTWGYKAGSMSFKDTMYQTTASGSGGSTENGSYGGTNASQVGYGVTTGSISYDFSTGGMSPSANGLDCMIDGTGFFIVGPMVNGGNVPLDTENAIKNSGLFLSRVGKFEVDNNGYLVDDSGNYVYGFKNIGELTSTDSFNTSALQPLKIPTTSDMSSVKNKKASDAVAAAQTAYNDAIAAKNTADSAMATAQQNYIQTKTDYDSSMTAYNVTNLKTAADTAAALLDAAYTKWNTCAPADELTLRQDYYTKLLDYNDKDFQYIMAKANICAPAALATATAATPNPGQIWSDYQTAFENYWGTSITPVDPLPVPGSAQDTNLTNTGKALLELENALSKTEIPSKQDTLDSAKLSVDKASKVATDADKDATEKMNVLEEAKKSASVIASDNTSSDELEKLNNYKILKDGTIVGTASDDTTIVLGKIALAGVQNTGGLEKDSGYYYSIGANAGNVSAYEGGSTVGKILGNYLEMAKVDLATEMTDMITTQRGFQANSKIITVTDTMLEELVNMKR